MAILSLTTSWEKKAINNAHLREIRPFPSQYKYGHNPESNEQSNQSEPIPPYIIHRDSVLIQNGIAVVLGHSRGAIIEFIRK